ncbi:MAG: ABC-three component system protein [Polyangiaceae bacterium]
MTSKKRATKHDAADSNTGYLYQCRYALYAALLVMGDEPNLEVSVEKFDDVAFERGDDPVALIQTKHHIKSTGSLADASVDLWKTLRIWADLVAKDPSAPFKLRFALLTTGQAPNDSAASFLRARDRDEDRAHKLLLKTASGRSKNVTNEPGYSAFRSLPVTARMALLKAIQVLDGSPNIIDIRDEIIGHLMHAAPRSKLELLVERLEGWWFGLVIRSMVGVAPSAIPVAAIESKIDELREAFRRDALPVDFANKVPSTEVVASLDKRPFVMQLRLIKVGDRRIEFAMRDFYRASEQRSKWAREDLLVDGELDDYQQRLIEAWEPHFEGAKDSLSPGCTSDTRVAAGQRVYVWAETEATFPLRTVQERFLTHGSYHILANEGRVGWHPDYPQHITPTLSIQKQKSRKRKG